jgi:glycosyltransferase involved in cell wall biosynthesis
MSSRVIVVAGKDPTLIDGGSESYLRAYGRAAIRAGYDPHHFCVSAAGSVEETEFGVIHRVYSPFRPFRGLMVAAHERYVVGAVNRFIGQHKGPHLIHSFGPWSGVGVAAAERLSRRNIKAVTAATPFGTYNHETRGKLRGLSGKRTLLRLKHEWELFWTQITVDPSERRGYLRSDIVLVNYDSVRNIISRQFGDGISFEKITYASEAAFIKVESRRSEMPEAIARLEPKDAPLLVSISRHDPRKGLDILLRALANLRREGIQFRSCLVGGGMLLDVHRRLVEKFQLSTCTCITGGVPDAYAYLEHADVFALPSLEEGSGSVSLLEAMQAGVPAVISGVDGLQEDVTSGRSAIIVEPGNVPALATALRRLFSEQNLRNRIADEGHRQYQERFSADAFTADLRRVYSRLGFPSPAVRTI